MPSEQRLHPLSILFALGANVRSLLLPGLIVLFAARRSGNWEVYLMLLFIPYTMVAVLRYLTLRYRFADDELVIRTGLIFRNVRHIPYGRIHNIGSVQNVLHRLFGVAEVRVETAGGQEPEARLQVLSLLAMEEMRRRVYEKKAAAAGVEGAAAAAGPAPVEEGRTLLRMPLSELVLCGLIDNRGLVVMAAIWGFFWQLGWQLGWLDGDDFRITQPVVGQIESHYRDFTLAQAILATTGLLIVFFGSMRVFSVAWTILKLYDFTLQRKGEDLSTTCGLLTRVSTSIPARRVQVITIREGPLHRLFKRMEIRADTVGGSPEEASAAQKRLAPLARRGEHQALLRDIQPEIDLQSVEWKPPHPRAARRIFKRMALVAGIVTVVASLNFGWKALLVLPLALPLLWLIAGRQARHLGYAVDDRGIYFKSGWVWRRLSGSGLDKVQSVGVTESPFDRRNGMASLIVDMAGLTHASHKIHIPFLEASEARRLHQLVQARAAQSAFTW